MTASQQEIEQKISNYKKQLDATHKNLLQLTWYMRGGVSVSELYEMPVTHIKHIKKIIEENFEMSKKAKTPIL